MNFEDRLRGHLQQQNDDLAVQPEGPNAVADRSTARRKRRAIGIPAAVIMLAGLAGGGYWASQTGETESVEIVADDTEENANDDAAADEVAEAVEPADAEANQAGAVDIDSFGAGPALTFQNIASENSPSGWAPNSAAEDGGIYYVLSTAPGEPASYESYGPDAYRPNTFYTYDGEWHVNEVQDYFVSDFEAQDGVLYAVSTGTSSTTAISFGTSNDKGATWNWKALPSGDYTEEEIATMNVQIASRGGQQMVVASRSNFTLHDDAHELATSGGLNIDRYSIAYVNDREFGYFDNSAMEQMNLDSMDECQRVEADYWNRLYDEREPIAEEVGDVNGEFVYDEEAAEAAHQQYIEETAGMYAALEAAGCGAEVQCRKVRDTFYNDPANRIEPPVEPPPPNATEAQMEAFNAAMNASADQMEELYKAQQEQLNQRLIDAGCGQEVTCRQLMDAMYSGPEFTPPFEGPMDHYGPYDELSEDELAELETQWAEHDRRMQEWHDASQGAQLEVIIETANAMEREGCDSNFLPYVDVEMAQLADEMGLALPADLVIEEPMMEDFEPPELIVVPWADLGVAAPESWRPRTLVNLVSGDQVSTTMHAFEGELVAANTAEQEFEIIMANNGMNFEPQTSPFVRWASTDGQAWSDEPAPYFAWQPGTNQAINGQRFRVDWNEGAGGAKLTRSIDNGNSYGVVELDELVAGLGDVEPSSVNVGPFGIIVSAHNISRLSPPTGLTYLYSPDGRNWSASEVDTMGYQAVVGQDSVLVLGTPTSGPGFDAKTDNSPVLLGRLGG